jgi:hypothetical protein
MIEKRSRNLCKRKCGNSVRKLEADEPLLPDANSCELPAIAKARQCRSASEELANLQIRGASKDALTAVASNSASRTDAVLM